MASRAPESARIEVGDDVVVVGPDLETLLRGALERVGESGSVVVVDPSADLLESLLTRTADPRVSFLIGDARVLPLPDASADVILATGEVAAAEVERVLRRRP